VGLYTGTNTVLESATKSAHLGYKSMLFASKFYKFQLLYVYSWENPLLSDDENRKKSCFGQSDLSLLFENRYICIFSAFLSVSMYVYKLLF